MFDLISNFVSKHGKPFGKHGGCFSIKVLFIEVWYEAGWVIDRNVDHLTFKFFGKSFYFSKEYEPIPF